MFGDHPIPNGGVQQISLITVVWYKQDFNQNLKALNNERKKNSAGDKRPTSREWDVFIFQHLSSSSFSESWNNVFKALTFEVAWPPLEGPKNKCSEKYFSQEMPLNSNHGNYLAFTQICILLARTDLSNRKFFPSPCQFNQPTLVQKWRYRS